MSSSQLSAPGDEFTVTIDVTNPGAGAGHKVVQLYVRDPESRLAQPSKELKAFARIELAAGETRAVELTLGMRALAYFDDARAAWVADAGEFEMLDGGSARDIHARASFALISEWAQPYEPQNAPRRELVKASR